MAAAVGEATTSTGNYVTQLLFACMQKRKDDVERMLSQTEYLSVLNVHQQDGWTACHYASSAGCKEIVQLLCERGADANAQTKRSKSTSLHLAAKRGHTGVVKMLLSFNADITILDTHGWTAQKLAKACGHTSLQQLLSLLEQRRSADKKLSGKEQQDTVPADGRAGRLEGGRAPQEAGVGACCIFSPQPGKVITSPTASKGSRIFDALPSSRYSSDKATAPHAGAGDEGIGGMVANAQKHSIKLVVPTAPEYSYTTARRMSAGIQNDFSKKTIERSQSAPGQDPSDDSNNVNKNSSGGSGTSVISRSANVFSKHVGTNGLCTEKENTAPSYISAGRAMSAGQSASSFVSQYGPRAALNKPMPPAGLSTARPPWKGGGTLGSRQSSPPRPASGRGSGESEVVGRSVDERERFKAGVVGVTGEPALRNTYLNRKTCKVGSADAGRAAAQAVKHPSAQDMPENRNGDAVSTPKGIPRL